MARHYWLVAVPFFIWLLFFLKDFRFITGVRVIVGIWALYHFLQRLFGMFKIENLERRAVFITGCDTGFGNRICIKCLKAGMPVFAGCLTESGAAALRQEAESLPGKLDIILVDVSKDDSVQKAAEYLESATKQYGGLHGVVNNAGIVGTSHLDDMTTINDYKKVLEVNTFGMIRVTKALKHLVKQTRGRIVNVTSICSRVGIAGIGPYTVSKFAASGYCEIVRQELAKFDVSVHTIEPGFFQTPMIETSGVQELLDQTWEAAPAKIKEEYGEEFFRDLGEASFRFLQFISSPKVEKVAGAYFHALTARYPHNKYQVGNDAKWLFVPAAFLPAGLRDAMAVVIEHYLSTPFPHQAVNKYRQPKIEVKESEDNSMPTITPTTNNSIVHDLEPMLEGVKEMGEVRIEQSSSV